MSNAKFAAAIAAINEQRDKSGIPIDGKLYSRVKDRIEVFRREWGDEYGIDTKISFDDGIAEGNVVVAIAKITRGENVLASGHAMVIIGSDEFTSTSPIEVAETSAIGRALACFGLHGGEYASSQEIEAKRREPFRDSDSPASRGPHNDMDPRAYGPSYYDDPRGDPRAYGHSIPYTEPRQRNDGPAPDRRDQDPNGPFNDPEAWRNEAQNGRQQARVNTVNSQPQQQRGRFSEPPPAQPSGLYVPDPQDEWQPEADQQRILAVVDSIDTVPLLGRYWNELKPFMQALGRDGPDLTAEIKAAFATANNVLGGK